MHSVIKLWHLRRRQRLIYSANNNFLLIVTFISYFSFFSVFCIVCTGKAITAAEPWPNWILTMSSPELGSSFGFAIQPRFRKSDSQRIRLKSAKVDLPPPGWILWWIRMLDNRKVDVWAYHWIFASIYRAAISFLLNIYLLSWHCPVEWHANKRHFIRDSVGYLLAASVPGLVRIFSANRLSQNFPNSLRN